MGDQFFDTIPAFTAFKDVVQKDRYRPLPEDWLIGVADVVNSTGALQAGRYKAVNTVGASVISAIMNLDRDASFPFVFGGDGAAFAVPESRRDAVSADALAGCQRWAEEEIESPAAGRPGTGSRRHSCRQTGSRRPVPGFTGCRLRNVFRRRHRLGRCRDEIRGICGGTSLRHRAPDPTSAGFPAAGGRWKRAKWRNIITAGRAPQVIEHRGTEFAELVEESVLDDL